MHRFLILASSLVLGLLPPTLPSSHAQLASLFGKRPQIKNISVEQLRPLQLQLLASTSGKSKARAAKPNFVLVDVRSSAEQSVSIIPGAWTAAEFEKRRAEFQGQTVIPYCTTGVRSERYARKLASDGFKVLNFKGSILAWCAAKLPLTTVDGKPTRRVHVYSARYRVPAEYAAVY